VQDDSLAPAGVLTFSNFLNEAIESLKNEINFLHFLQSKLVINETF
jgi:hypothetical protein